MLFHEMIRYLIFKNAKDFLQQRTAIKWINFAADIYFISSLLAVKSG